MGEMIPIVLFAMIAAIVWIIFHNRSKAHKDSLKIINKMVERGDKIDSETVKALGAKPVSPQRDLKIGMILIALAIAMVIFGNLVPDEEEAPRAMLGLASFPFLVGLVYCSFWFMFDRNKS